MEEQITYVGVDNGVSGGVAGLVKGEEPMLTTIPLVMVGGYRYIDSKALLDLLTSIPGKKVILLEQGAKNPYFGTVGNFSNGYNFGVVKTVLELGGFKHVCVLAQQWQKDLFSGVRGKSKGNTKGNALEVVKQLFPNVNLLRTPKCKKPHDGMADALLIAEWGRRKNL